MRTLPIILLSWCHVAGLFAQGFITPFHAEAGMPVLASQHVTVHVKAEHADVELVETYHNPHDTDVQGFYNFSLPSEAGSNQIELLIKDRAFKGELLNKEDARQIYLSAFRNTHEHALLQLLGRPLYRVRLYPIFARNKQKITIRYSEPLDRPGSLYKLVVPLRKSHTREALSSRQGRAPDRYASLAYVVNTTARSSVPAAAVEQSVRVVLPPDVAPNSVYSPSHHFTLEAESGKWIAVASGDPASFAGDFVLFFDRNNHATNVHLLTHHPGSADEDGYFALLLTRETPKGRRLRMTGRNYVFLVDISTSMKGARLRETKDALSSCLSRLDDKDCFNIVTFNGSIKLFQKEMVPALRFRQAAIEFVRKLSATGGSNLNEALLAALTIGGGIEGERRMLVITDGQPTVGIVEPKIIRKNVRTLNRKGFAIFTFGLGHDINTTLLDGIATESGGQPYYVEAASDLGRTLTAFFVAQRDRSARKQVVEFEPGDAVTDMYLPRWGSGHPGRPTVAVGRYRTPGQVKVTYRPAGADAVITRSFQLPDQTDCQNDFIERLWHFRRAGYVADKVRFGPDGDDARELLAEMQRDLEQYIPDIHAGGTEAMLAWLQEARNTGKTVGSESVALSSYIGWLRRTQWVPEQARARWLGGRRFVLDRAGVWQEQHPREALPEPLKIQYESQAYFTLLENYAEVAPYLALGPHVVFEVYERFIRIGEHGYDQLSKTDLDTMLRRGYP